jgi:hypothetical protein
MATLIRNHTGWAQPLPAAYGSVVLQPGGSLIVADTIANANIVLNNPVSDVLELSTVPDGEPGAIIPGIPDTVGKATVAAATATVAAVPAGFLKPLTAYKVKAHVAGIGTPASSSGTRGKALASELVGMFATNSSGVPVLTGTVTSVSVILDSALDAGDVPTLSVQSGAIAVQGVAAAAETIDYSALIKVEAQAV